MILWEEVASANIPTQVAPPSTLFCVRKKLVHAGLRRIVLADDGGAGGPAGRPSGRGMAKTLALIELIIGEREKGPSKNPPKNRHELLDLAIMEEYLEWVRSEASPGRPEERDYAAALWLRLEAILATALASNLIPKRPALFAREVLPALSDGLEKAKRLICESLFLPPRLEALIGKEKTELEQTIQNLRDREAKILEESQWLENERQKCLPTGDPAQDAERATRSAELEQKWKGLCEKAAELNAEEARCETQIKLLERKYPTTSNISAFDARRKSVFSAFDPMQISSEEVAERARFVKAWSQSLDQKLAELEGKLPPACRDSEGETVNLRFWCFAWIAAQRERAWPYGILGDRELYFLVYGGGTLYREMKTELDEVVTHLEGLGAEFQMHLKIVNEIKDLVRQGNVFAAEKRFKGLVPKFKDIRYQNVQSVIEESLRIHREAQRLVADVAEYQSKNQGFFAKMFRDKARQNGLEQRLIALQGKEASLPKSELKSTVGGLLQEAESKWRG